MPTAHISSRPALSTMCCAWLLALCLGPIALSACGDDSATRSADADTADVDTADVDTADTDTNNDAGIDTGADASVDTTPDTPPAPRVAVNLLPELSAWTPDDLQALDPVVEGADVIALGEALHGSGGLHTSRAVIIKRLVEVHGARYLMFESPWVLARAADRYVTACAGTPEEATASLFYYIWYDQAIRDTLAWLCDHNRANPDAIVRVGGFDVQNAFDDVHLLAETLPALTDTPDAIVEELRYCRRGDFDDIDDYLARDGQGVTQDNSRCADGVDRLEALLDTFPDDDPNTRDARLAAISLRAWVGITTARTNTALFTARDTGMADMVQAQWPGDAPVMLYLANSHASTQHPDVRAIGGVDYLPEGGRSTGTVLRERLGDAYVAIATTAAQLHVNRKGTPLLIDNDGPDTLAAALQDVAPDAPAVLLDLGSDDAQPWRALELNMVMFNNPRALVLGDQFDAVVHLNASAPMRDAIAATYDGPFRDELAAFRTDDGTPSQRVGGYTGITANGQDTDWTLILRYPEAAPPDVDTPIDLSESNAIEAILSRDGAFWFAVAGTLTPTQNDAPDGILTVRGDDVVFWPLFANSWLIPGPEAVRFGRFNVTGAMSL